jgi:hypothetical protein
VMYFFARLRINLQISIFGFSHKLLVFSIFHLENVKSESHTPLRKISKIGDREHFRAN